MSCFVITESGLPTPIVPDETASLIITLSVVDQRVDNYREIIPYVSIDGVEVDIRRCAWNRARGAIGTACEFTLADTEDRSLLTPAASLLFKIGLKKNGVISWKVIADLQRLSQRSFSVDGDEVSFSSVSGITEKLNTSPVTPFMMYDPDKVTFDAALQEKLYDTEGRVYPVEAIPVTGLTLYNILEEILVNRCGFTGTLPFIDDFKIPQISCDVTETYLSVLSPFIEPFCREGEEGPLLVESDGVLKIYDTSRPLPPDFPAPRDLSDWACSSLSIGRDYSDVTAAKMVFSVPDVFDYVTNRIVITNLPTGDDRWTLTVRNVYELRSYFQPTLIMDEREQLFWELISDLLGNQYSQEIQSSNYDRFARVVSTQTQRWFVSPLVTGAFASRVADEDELQTFTYLQHPTRIGKQYQAEVRRQLAGLNIVDADNPYFDEPFKQQLRLAHWAGNANDAVTVERSNLRIQNESLVPHRNGQVTRRALDYDRLRDLPINLRRDTQVADPSLNGDGSTPRSREMLVTEDGSEHTGGKVITIHTGVIPLEPATALVKRRLAKVKLAPTEATLGKIGFDPNIDPGKVFSASDKSYALEGNFICVGDSGAGENLGTKDEKWSMSVEGIEI